MSHMSMVYVAPALLLSSACSCLLSSAEFRATCGRYIKEVFSMPGSITDQEVSPAAAREQVRANVWV